MKHSVLRWLEWSLLAVGIALAVWVVVIMINARRYQSMPIPPLEVTQQLPADSGNASRHGPSPKVGSVIARLEAPSVSMTTNVLEGSDDRTLDKAAGHLEDTPLPGQTGNIAIAGHRDTVFRPLKRIKVGDPLVLTTADRVYSYRISNTLIVGPKDVYVLDPTKQPTLTLVTCYPFEFIGHAPRRFIVQAQLVANEARIAQPDAPEKSGRSGGAGR